MVDIEHDSNHSQFITADKRATLSYRILPEKNVWDYYRTYVPPDQRGHHIGQDLVKFALDYALQNSYQVIPSCPFVRAYIERHPEYTSLVSQ